MSLPSFDEEPSENSSDHGTCYVISPTDDVPVSGRVFVDMAEHTVHGHGEHALRPQLVFRFFGLSVNRRWLGEQVSTAAFYPSWSEHRPGISMLSLGEPGYLVIEAGRLLSNQPGRVDHLVDAVLAELSLLFLTDLRVAQYRQARAAQRRERAARTQALAEVRKDVAWLRYRQALHAADQADALLAAVRERHVPDLF